MAALASAAARAGEHDNTSKAGKEKEQQLLAVLRSGQPAEKAITCKELAIYGSEDSVPALAKLLTDKELASWARIALEAIPGPAADKALREAIPSLSGNLLIGTINSIGFRRDPQAVDALAGRLQDKNANVASAAAVALGHIGNPAATKLLQGSLADAPPGVRSAVAEGCVLCAERLLADGKSSEAAQLYDQVRRAKLPKQRIVEATRGAILARKSGGVELLLEQLRSPDKVFFQLGLGTARELGGREVADALAAELPGAAPDRAALLLGTLADRNDTAVLPAVLEAVNSGPQQVRLAAIDALAHLGNDSCVATLLQIAAGDDEELAQAAKKALAELPGERVDADIAGRLPHANGKKLAVLIEVVGQRQIDATPALLKAIDDHDAAVRGAALTALGATVGSKKLPVLVAYVVAPKYPADAAVAQQALRAAATRMPDREACAKELAAAMPKAPVATRAAIVEILAAVAGTTALETIGTAAKSPEPELQDAATRVLGEWMSVDAAPVLLDLAKSAPGEKYQSRSLRGYLRLARQFPMSDSERVEMCEQALGAAKSPAEKKLVMDLLVRYPNPTLAMLKLAVEAIATPTIKPEAMRAAIAIAQKLGDKAAGGRELLARIPLPPVKLEIIKAECGDGKTQKDVTEALRQQAGNSRLMIVPPSVFRGLDGGQVRGTAIQLKVRYRINGKPAEASFADASVIVLPMPK
jgi:HEAT repeat protein